MDKAIKNNSGLELVTSPSSGYETKFKKISLLFILSGQIWWCNIKWFLSYSKNYTCKFMQVSSWHHKLFHFHSLFWICKVKKEEKLEKLEYLENQKSFLHEIKNIFHSFWSAIIWLKNKNLIKNSEHKVTNTIRFK